MATGAEAALQRVLAVFDLLIDAVDEDALVPALLPLLLRAIPGDSIVWTPHPRAAGPLTLPADLLDAPVLEAFARGAGLDPLVRHTTTGPGTPARRSDLQSRRGFHAMPVYAEVYRPLGAEHQLAMSFSAAAAGPPRRICVCVNRHGGDFGETDLETARMLRGRLGRTLDRLAVPPSGAAARAAGGEPRLDRTAAPGPASPQPPLTRREAAVVGLLAHGLTNEQIAHRLSISPRTVDKHLEHAYPKLRVGGRVEAANAWLAGPGR
jgi:DNA-binding CsgD family transcriptional regulator